MRGFFVLAEGIQNYQSNDIKNGYYCILTIMFVNEGVVDYSLKSY